MTVLSPSTWATVLVYFGYPRAHEDDAERAIRAGLGIIDAVGELDIQSMKLQARVGIATGLVVVGDLIGEGSSQEQSVVGETPNLAARLQALAAAGHASLINSASTTDEEAYGRCQTCAAVLLQSQSWSRVPLPVLPPVTSRQRPDCGFIRRLCCRQRHC